MKRIIKQIIFIEFFKLETQKLDYSYVHKVSLRLVFIYTA
jgi:hypothetical protein